MSSSNKNNQSNQKDL